MTCSCQPEVQSSCDYKLLYEQECRQTAVLEERISVMSKENHALRLRDVPMSNYGHEWMVNLQYKVKHLSERVAVFETGKIYVDMKAAHKAQREADFRKMKQLKKEIAAANARNVTMNDNWMNAFDDQQKEHEKELKAKQRELDKMENRALRAERQRDETKDKLLEKIQEKYAVETELNDIKEKNLQLIAQIKRDYENSSISSSLKPNKKKIHNSREKTGKKPGGQIGHKHHPRKRHTPTSTVAIPAPEKYMNNPDYVLTGRIITKQHVDIQLVLNIIEYSTPEFRNIRTNTRVCAEFPGGLVNEITYGGNLKAFMFLLNSHCNVSIDKVSDFVCELTGGKLKPSTGMICGLTKEFSKKTEAEQKKAFADMLLEPVINTDFTCVRVDGKNDNALVCATPNNVLYFARPHKGHEGIKGTPLETILQILVHDHDTTFYSYGGNHQECLDHILRYLVGSMENEPNLKWNQNMHCLLREMIHFRKHLYDEDNEENRNPNEIVPDKVKTFEAKYDEILNIAKNEYEYEPPSKYYKDGFNLYKRLYSYKRNHLLFLYDKRVPYSNSLAERLLRILKRKQHQVMSFRSFEGFEALCNCLGVIATLRLQDKNLYESVSSIFDRRMYKVS